MGKCTSRYGTINANIARDKKNRLRMFVYPENEIGKNAITHFKVVERFGYIYLLEVILKREGLTKSVFI